MVLSETVQFAIIFAVTVVFTAFSLTIEKEGLRMALKIIAVISWFTLSLSTFFFFGTDALLAVPLTFLFMGIGIVLAFTTVSDWTAEKKDRIWNFSDE